MLSKNVAEYTNFEGKTNKKILQAPGGSSSISLAWSNQKTDYGNKQQYQKNILQNNLNCYSKNQCYNTSEPIRVMDVPIIHQNYKNIDSQQNGMNIGGSYGYNNYRNSPNTYKNSNYPQQKPKEAQYWKPQPYSSYSSSRTRQPKPIQELDLAVEQHKKLRNEKIVSIPSMPKHESFSCEGKSSIKINGPPRQNNVFAGNDYNYWKDYNNNTHSNKKTVSTPDHRIINQHDEQLIKKNHDNVNNIQKTSIRVTNCPGGKQTFVLG